MPQRLLIVAAAGEADAIRRSITGTCAGSFEFERAASSSDGVSRLHRRRAPALDAVLVGLPAGDVSAVAHVNKLRNASPDTPMLALVDSSEMAVGMEAMLYGADDYVLKRPLDDAALSKALVTMLWRKRCAEGLDSETGRAKRTLDSIGDGVISTDVSGNVTYLNPVAETLSGWRSAEALGRPLDEVLTIIDGDSRETALNPVSLAIRDDRPFALGENCILIGRNGHESAIEDTAAPIHDHLGRVTGAVIVFHDVGTARAQALKMSHLAMHDPLTGLPNRLLLSDRVNQAIELALRHGSPLALLYVDVDRFKAVNDTYGHDMGDRLLQSVATRLTSCMRKSDTVSRWGGDEFVVLLPEMTFAGDALRHAERLQAALDVSHSLDGLSLRVTASIGVAVYPKHGTELMSLLQHADRDLRAVKTARSAALGLRQQSKSGDPR